MMYVSKNDVKAALEHAYNIIILNHFKDKINVNVINDGSYIKIGSTIISNITFSYGYISLNDIPEITNRIISDIEEHLENHQEITFRQYLEIDKEEKSISVRVGFIS